MLYLTIDKVGQVVRPAPNHTRVQSDEPNPRHYVRLGIYNGPVCVREWKGGYREVLRYFPRYCFNGYYDAGYGRVVNLVMEDKPEYEWMTVEFRPDGKVINTRYEPGGTKTITEERYRIVGKTLIIHKTDYIINAEYKIYGNELIVTCERFRALLQRI